MIGWICLFMPPQSGGIQGCHCPSVRPSVRTSRRLFSDLILIFTHVCDHNILIKFDSHGNRLSHLGVTALYLQIKNLKNILSGSNFYTVRSTCLKHSQMFILYVQIILNNHYGFYFLWQKIRSGGIRVLWTHFQF